MIACWIVQAVASSHTLDSDGVSYVDMARAVAQGHWQAAINAYWSPGYPVLFSCWLRILKPSAYHIILAVRLFTLLSLIAALASFEFFRRTVLQHRHQRASKEAKLSDWSLTVVGTVLFFWTTCWLTPPSINSPDIFVLSVCLLAGAMSLRIVDRPDGWLDYAALGLVLGLGFLMKAVMFPLSFFFLGAVAASVPGKRAATRMMVTLGVLFLVAGPFLLALSRKSGYPTFGAAGPIAYAQTVNGAETRGYWRGEEPGTGAPAHPIRRLMDSPVLYEYAMPEGGSLPLWLHHAYWYEGVRPHLDLRKQLHVIHRHLDAYFALLGLPLGPLIAAFFLLVFLEGNPTEFLHRFSTEAVLWVPALAGFGIYALVNVEGRFLGGLLILLWAALWLALSRPEGTLGEALDRNISLVVAVLLGVQIVAAVGHSLARIAAGNPFPDWAVAAQLNRKGVQPGDKVCYLGDPVWDDAWALLAGVQIICNLPATIIEPSWSPRPFASSGPQTEWHWNVPEFWATSPLLRARILETMRRAGARAVVARNVPRVARQEGWKQVSNTDYYILRLAN
jgi:hypothetical protein